jgi:D-alanyl-D-alanine-carboxypeptidase/D-alanyl-D-alanine-endopeptidase
LLDRYVGRYGTPPDLILVIRREGDHLSVQENDEPKEELFGETDRDFFAKVNDDAYTFELDAQGRVTSMTLHADGKDIPLKRID